MMDHLGEARTIDDVAGVAVGRIVVVGSTSVQVPTSDNEGNLIGVTTQEQLVQDDPVEVAEYGVAVVEVQESVAKGEYCVAGVDGYGRPESAFKSGAELNVVGVFVDSVSYSSGVAYARVRIGIAKRIRRETETLSDVSGQDALPEGITYLSSSAAGTSAVLVDGAYSGQRKVFMRTDSTSEIVSVEVTNHILGAAETFAFPNGGSFMIFVWDSERGVWVTEHDGRVIGGFNYNDDTYSNSNCGDSFGFSADNLTPYISAGLSGNYGSPIILLDINITAVGNVTTGEDDLQSYTLPANALVRTKDIVRITKYITFAANANSKRYRVYFNTTVLFDTTGLLFNAASAKLVIDLSYTGSGNELSCALWVSDSALLATAVTISTPAVTVTSNRVIKGTGEATATDDIIEKKTIIEYFASPDLL